MSDKIRKAYSEVYEILQLLDDEFIDKVPKKFMEFIEKEKDNDYIPNIKPNVSLEEQELLEDTINILAMLKLDYWCENEAEKQELLDILNKNEIEYQQELREKYNPDNLFKNKNKSYDENVKEEKSLVIKAKKNFIIMLFEKIKMMFKKQM